MTRAGRGALTWCFEDFCWFYERLTLPDGRQARLEGFQLLILRTLFASGRVELLVLIPKGHAKTTLMAALAIFHLLITPNANCYIGAADKIQAGEMYRFACHFVQSEPEISARLNVLGGTKEIRSRVDQGFLLVLASDDSKQGGKRQGFNPTFALLDELHAHENDSLYTDMRSGLFKRSGLLCTITTAGWDLEGALGRLRQSFLDVPDIERGLVATDDGGTRPDALGRLTVAHKASGNSTMLEWACIAEDDLDDMSHVKRANPASWVTIGGLEDAHESLTPWAFRRYRANVWTLGFESWLPTFSWDALSMPLFASLDPALPAAGALDMARYRDSAALVVVQARPAIAFIPATAKALWIRRGSPDDPVPYEEAKEACRDMYGMLPLTHAIGFDPRYFDQAASELLAEGLPMEEFPQSNERMCPAADSLRRAIVTEKAFVHDGDAEFAAHVMAPVAKDIGDNMFKLVKPRRNAPPIDGCIALAMAYELARIGSPAVSAEWW